MAEDCLAFKAQAALTLLAIAIAGILGGFQVASVVGILAVLEISLSFDNAVVNATVLQRMTTRWQTIFLTLGIVIAVFGVRLLFPMIVVGIAGGLNPFSVLDLALNSPAEYAARLADAHPVIAAFGGVFLLMIFLDFFFESRETMWVTRLENTLARIGRFNRISVLVVTLVLIVVALALSEEHTSEVLISGLAGLVAYLAVKGLSDLFDSDADIGEPSNARDSVDTDRPTRTTLADRSLTPKTMARTGLLLFLYLELLDASFSFDGVVGAFAISSNIFVIAAGLGIGAIYIRSMTVYLVRNGTLAEYVYLEHGAHYAIGALAILLLTTVKYQVPELITGLVGVSFIGLALISSLWRRREEGELLQSNRSEGEFVG